MGDEGWRDFHDPYRHHKDTPYQHKRIWVWRPEWTNGPQALSTHDLNPSMNVIGLKWKPYDGHDAGTLEYPMTNPLPTGSDASVTEEMVEAALGAFLGAKAPDGCTIDDYLWIDPLDAVELGVKLALAENTGKPRYHGYSDIRAEEQLWARQQLLRPMIRAALTAALSLPTPKGKHIEDVYPDEAVAWKWSYSINGLPQGPFVGLRYPPDGPEWDDWCCTPLSALLPASQLLAAKQQGIAEGLDQGAELARIWVTDTGNKNGMKASLGIAGALRKKAAAIRGAS